MSRIGKRLLTIPEGVTVDVSNNEVTVKGPKGELKQSLKKGISVVVDGNNLEVKRDRDYKTLRQLHGTINSLISNMITGVTEGYKKELEMVGVGYRFQVAGNKITINAGYSHSVEMIIPDGISVEQKSNTEIIIEGIDKILVGEFAANVRKVKKPEPYKGKGIRYKGEQVRRKEGKKVV